MPIIKQQTHTSFALSLALLLACSAAAAQEEDESAVGISGALMEEVTVTARKREEPVQQVPVSISAFSGEQIEALKVRDLQGLSVNMPNVAMDDIGTTPGVANFSIRGLGINSSIPGIDPTVGVFIDGVYIGQNAGVVIDMFDVKSLEVLRGPQGTLFGRNVTGGAVLINTRGPTDEFELSARAAVDGNPNGDGGLNYFFMGAVGGPVSDTLNARLSLYHNDDKGWFENLYDGSNYGESKTTIFRPVVSWHPDEDVTLLLRWEHTESDSDGPASQNHTNGSGRPGFFVNYERDSFDFSVDAPGFLDFEMDFVTAQVDWDVPFGNGTVTNIFGWREYYHDSYADIDAQPVWLFHASSIVDQEQFSNELRYNGIFGQANVTAGVYWFDNEINYSENRELLGIATGGVAPALTQNGGGILAVESLAAFFSMDYMLNEAWSLNAGIRYTTEDKDAQIATLTRNLNNGCVVYEGTCNYDFVNGDSWDAVSGKLGFTYAINDDMRMYAHWSRGHRSGGYNLRNTAIDTVNLGPGPFDEETVDSYELGYKSELGGRGRLNAAVFYTTIDDMQREVNLADPFAGVVQVIKNTADADMWGFEVESTFALGSNTVLLASLGWVDPSYSTVRFDLNGDGVIDGKDEALKLPRAAEWTYSIGLTHDWLFDSGSALTARANYAFRDDAFYTDNNLGYLLSQEMLDAGLDYAMSGGRWVFSLYGSNLLNDVNHGGDTQLPAMIGPVPAGGTFSPLIKGRIVGFEVTFNY
ncbi:MAG: TonB-dependent receptor [Lysobacterales bacterium]|nr:MAG: TonB-dependent receptor [Xanthomonadales bacterium]